MELTSSLSRDLVLEVSKKLGEPQWLQTKRLEAWETFAKLPYPTTRTEEWKYTDITEVPFEELPLELPKGGVSEIPQAVQDRLAQAQLSGYAVFVGADLVHVELPEEYRQQGVIFTSLHQALAQHPELVEANLFQAVNWHDLVGAQKNRPENSKIPALGAALFTHGVFLYIPKNVEFSKPIGVFKYLEGGRLSSSRTLIVGDVNSQAVYIEEYISPARVAPSVNTSSTEIIVGNGAKVRHAHIQLLGQGFYHFHRQRAHLQRDAALNDLVVNMGASISRAEVQSEMLGPGSSSEMLGLYFTTGQEHVDHYTLQHHVADHAYSDVLYKGAAKDQSRTVYAGLIKVEQGAQKTDAYQTNRNLLLSADARSDSVPQLEIGANDVKCSHGSSTAPVAPEELFYLMSRGLPRHLAQQILVKGHMADVLTRIPIEPLRQYIESIIEEKVRV
ncbi:Fe-S cluster assembly protein SufD [Meiothermus taiwanensis]|uniref:FeS cluster assembly protein SufB n=2 Tax=Meiothermus taiwanensis TaxID=172827 RepID=A0A399DWB2_9DEIN|nr:Fe-S cluster assembly protein SufD [Meiothermus taiwanensis]AWR85750.1 FeS assembly protein SufD [Meiothermus taiwanensis WR-220]KIQ53625.1 ABC transporter ATP-binding protein [Meiothermus taiwanensis]KZK14957.1 Fe-S cluster assembly protein SufD [Meiothermus taiwanensis]RIH75508.1 FeS cluster assembly protein SufB [Meiothermus taiwanensis]